MNAQEILELAAVNKLRLTATEETDLKEYMEFTLGVLDKMADIDTTNVTPMIFSIDVSNVFREDVAAQNFSRGQILAGAPEQEENCFRVPMVVE